MQIKAMPVFRKTAETFTSGAKTLPQSYFISPEVFVREQERILSTQWLCIGHQSQIAKAGDYFVQEVAGESLIILRDQQGEVYGFYNVCRHRGTRLCEEKTGQLRETIQCPYHAWTYGLDGRLTGAPHMDKVDGFDKAEHSLHAVRLGLWQGFIFVNLGEEPTPLETAFAPLAGKFTHWNLPELRSAKRIEYDVRANWKLIFQNYSECYHCPLVHPALSKLTPYDSTENDLCEGPFLGGFMLITQGSMTMSGNACALPVGDIKGADHHRVFYYSIFPNLLLSLHPDYVMVHQVWPQSPERVIIFCDWFFHPHAFGRADFHPDDAIEFWDMTNREDWHVCELSQQGIASRAYRPGPYSPRESIVAAWDREYLRVLGKFNRS
ncbi:MAG TPA: aromatic ring-hydroxylating dioxygenase subunit alpha [Candidatus Eisenbacteria bacterium]|jgi:Rieske 2Fe-2S family protein|nr:aromatic ring-hydroxylating dioxygenase subunit alpha [Candidatus Eisenbacteria bacterium]